MPIDWTNKVPPYDSQYSATTHIDAQDCTVESFCHIFFSLTGIRVSPRALGYLLVRDGLLTPNGSRVLDVLNYANKYKLVSYDLWPTPDSFTWDSYYAPVPQELYDNGISCQATLQTPDLNISPLWTELMFNPTASVPGPAHMVEQINETQYFDSEQGNPIKPLNYEGAKVVYQTSIIIKLLTPMLIYKFDDSPTEYALTDDATLLGFANEDAVTKTLKGRTAKYVVLPAAQRTNFVIADSAIN